MKFLVKKKQIDKLGIKKAIMSTFNRKNSKRLQHEKDKRDFQANN